MTEPDQLPNKSKLMEDLEEGNDGVFHDGNHQKVEPKFDDKMDHLEIKLVEDSNHLLNFLPEEVWILVMDQLTDSSSDLEQLSNASPYFRKLLLPKRVLFHFPQVLKLTFPNLMDFCAGSFAYGPTRPIYLCLRTVCTSWNKTADSLVQEKRDEFNFEIDNKRRVTPPFLTSYLGIMSHCFKSIGSVTLFLKHFEDTHFGNCERSPFIFGDVEISFHEIERQDHPVFVNQLTNLIHMYGHHIFQLRLSDSDYLLYTNLRDWLLSLVNLKILQFDRSLYNRPRPFPRATELQQLNAEIKEHPLPKLKDLHTLDTYTLPLPAPLFNEIIRNCPQISALQLGLRRGFAGKYALVPLPNLSQLQVCFLSWDKFSRFDWSRPALPRPISVSILPDFNLFVKWSDLFQCIQNNWSDVLEQLPFLEMPRPRNQEDCESIYRDSAQFRLELPRLRHLKLIITDIAHLDFLLGLKDSLKSLSIYSVPNIKAAQRFKLTFCECSNPFTPLVEFRGKEDTMLESNIWNLFPNLDNLSVVFNFRPFEYTRAQWVSHQQSNDN